jgi:hypothetical protein
MSTWMPSDERAKPRWSTVSVESTEGSPAAMAGLLEARASVGVKPPLLAYVRTPGETPVTSPLAVKLVEPGAWTRLWPWSLSSPLKSRGVPSSVFPATIVFSSVAYASPPSTSIPAPPLLEMLPYTVQLVADTHAALS